MCQQLCYKPRTGTFTKKTVSRNVIVTNVVFVFFPRRIHRIGQNASSCLYDYLLAENSWDEKVFRKVQQKYKTIDKIIDRGANSEGYDITEEQLFERVEEEAEEDTDEPPTKRQRS